VPRPEGAAIRPSAAGIVIDVVVAAATAGPREFACRCSGCCGDGSGCSLSPLGLRRGCLDLRARLQSGRPDLGPCLSPLRLGTYRRRRPRSSTGRDRRGLRRSTGASYSAGRCSASRAGTLAGTWDLPRRRLPEGASPCTGAAGAAAASTRRRDRPPPSGVPPPRCSIPPRPEASRTPWAASPPVEAVVVVAAAASVVVVVAAEQRRGAGPRWRRIRRRLRRPTPSWERQSRSGWRWLAAIQRSDPAEFLLVVGEVAEEALAAAREGPASPFDAPFLGRDTSFLDTAG
jgi:hypothetical protein